MLNYLVVDTNNTFVSILLKNKTILKKSNMRISLGSGLSFGNTNYFTNSILISADYIDLKFYAVIIL